MRLKTAQRGFTILELMAGITVFGILLAIGVPSFNEIIRNNRTATQANDLIGALWMARSEADTRGMPVSICASNAEHTDCAGAAVGNWSNGWLIFSDRTGAAGTINAAVPVEDGDQILHTSPAITGGLQLTTGHIGFVRFDVGGARINPPPGTAFSFDLVHSQCTGENRRTIELNTTGRPSLNKVAC